MVIKSDPEVDSVKKLGPRLHGLIWLNPNQPGKNKIKIKVLIFHIKKIRNNLYEYRLYML